MSEQKVAAEVVCSSAELGPRAWALFAPNGNYRIWSTVREELERVAAEAGAPITPLYELTTEEVQAVNKLRARREWMKRDLTRCNCDHNEYCQHCWPESFRPGGVWHGLGA